MRQYVAKRCKERGLKHYYTVHWTDGHKTHVVDPTLSDQDDAARLANWLNDAYQAGIDDIKSGRVIV